MNLRISTLAIAGGAVLLAASSTAIAEKQNYSPKAAAKLSKALAGRTAGPPVSCIDNFRGGARMEVIDDYTILFREGATVYVQKPSGGCYGLGNGNYTLVTRMVGTHRLCRGQISDLVDPVSRSPYGSCVLGDFVPYRKAR